MSLLDKVVKKHSNQAAGGAALAVGKKPVIFACSPASCIAAIVAPTFQFVIIGKGGGLVPVGTTDFLFEVQGPAGADFKVECEGGKILPKPIQGTLPNLGAKGVRALEVA